MSSRCISQIEAIKTVVGKFNKKSIANCLYTRTKSTYQESFECGTADRHLTFRARLAGHLGARRKRTQSPRRRQGDRSSHHPLQVPERDTT